MIFKVTGLLLLPTNLITRQIKNCLVTTAQYLKEAKTDGERHEELKAVAEACAEAAEAADKINLTSNFIFSSRHRLFFMQDQSDA